MKTLKQPRRSTVPAASEPVTFGRILVPVDFSPHSRVALNYAVRFASQHGSELILLHVVEPITYPAEPGYPAFPVLQTVTSVKKAAKTQLEQLSTDTVPPGIDADIKIRVGRSYKEIAEAAEELDADLIIISTHGHTGLKHILLGSTAEHVVRYAPCPVLTLRRED